MDDEDEATPVVGRAEPAEGHEDAAWLYLPDMESQTGWVTHPVPKGSLKQKRLGFRALRDE